MSLSILSPLAAALARIGRTPVSGAPEGFDALVIAEAAKARKGLVVHVARDDARSAEMADALAFFAPSVERLEFPAWDCLPYDRTGPKPEVTARRMAALAALAGGAPQSPCVLLTTLNAALQRVPPRAGVAAARFVAKPGNRVSMDRIVEVLTRNGFARTSAVVDPGDFAVRGGLIDLFPPGSERPLRLDLFGDTLESIRSFDPDSQKSVAAQTLVSIVPASEVLLDPDAVARFRTGYAAAFGTGGDDPLYEAVSAGRKYGGMEHWLPLFHETLETVLDCAGDAPVFLDHQMAEIAAARHALIADYYEARVQARSQPKAGIAAGAPPYKPVKPAALYLPEAEWEAALARRPVLSLSPFAAAEAAGGVPAGAKRGRDFAPERMQPKLNVFDAVAAHVKDLQAQNRRVVVACWSPGSAERMGAVLSDHGVSPIAVAEDYDTVLKRDVRAASVAVIGLEHGFETPSLAVIGEQDILGDRLVRVRKTQKRAANFIAEAAQVSPGDLVVHVDHGIGRFEGLKTILAAGAPHDCLDIQYDGGKLYLPVENIELVSRFGADSEGVQLDRLGGSGWQSRKAKLKNRIRDMAAELIKIAAERELKKGPVAEAPHGLYDEFCARFPFQETDDQEKAIADVMEDLTRGRPMDRLICGDVGFGKTEVALRAAFVMAMTGRQVAVVVPTTLLARQHFKTFANRFQGLPVRIRQLSRLIAPKDAAQAREEIAKGACDIVVGTHALLAKSIAFKDLGLLIVDEEQHFGVAHKERLKQLKANVHVLTLSATPIPRTLQLAMTGVKDLSIIATPPIDRLAVRTFVSPFDPVVVREALLREHYRGGQSFFVCPRISDLADVEEFLKTAVPEVKSIMAHGQMPPSRLEDVMSAFYEGKFGVLLSTPIVESGLDIPTANTLIVRRAEMFGLAQLYQLRGRIGRSKARAYAYLTTPPDKRLTAHAERRLHVLQSLDTLGAGFTLASHDLDIRGAGNLLGEEQSGHVREVGIELYQSMLEEAVASLRGSAAVAAEEAWSPQISVGSAVLIPESYAADLNVRLTLYRRLSELEEERDIEAFGAELIDRFGPLPDEVRTLLRIVAIKRLCRIAQVEKFDAGPKGATVSFRGNAPPNPGALVRWIGENAKTAKVRPDQKLVVLRQWDDAGQRLNGAYQLASALARLAG
jgi:transcription-repair coupling factor (superfamily II helicase)